MPIPVIALTENYAAFTVLTQAQLNAAIGDAVAGSAEYALNTYCRNNLNQIALDTFGVTYDYANDGVASFPTPLIDLVALLAQNETVTGSWVFTGQATFQAPVSGTSTFTSSGQPRCRAYLTTANQSIPSAVSTAVLLQAESYDVGNMHDNGILPSRVIVPTGGAGLYSIVGQVEFASNATGIREARLYKNGALMATQSSNSLSANLLSLQVAFQDQASTADYYELQAYQSSGVPLDITFGSNRTFLSVMKVW